MKGGAIITASAFPQEMIVPVVFALAVSLAHGATQWPVPPKEYQLRPPVDRYCDRALYPFCPTGFSDGHLPSFPKEDKIELYVLKAPVWEFKYGKLLGKFKIYHDAIGINSYLTSRNYTTEWYELFQLFNCSFAHIVSNRTAPVWCNQGALCLYPGIDDIHWSKYGTLKKVGDMSGAEFNNLAQYLKTFNQTFPYYETFRVRNSSDSKHYQQWFGPVDCASYVQKFFCQAAKYGAKFVEDYLPDYTYITLYSNEPKLLGNASQIFGADGDKDLAEDIRAFYSHFRAHQPTLKFVESIIDILDYVLIKKEFYFFFNEQYWLLPMKEPFLKIHNDPVEFEYCMK